MDPGLSLGVPRRSHIYAEIPYCEKKRSVVCQKDSRVTILPAFFICHYVLFFFRQTFVVNCNKCFREIKENSCCMLIIFKTCIIALYTLSCGVDGRSFYFFKSKLICIKLFFRSRNNKFVCELPILIHLSNLGVILACDFLQSCALS